MIINKAVVAHILRIAGFLVLLLILKIGPAVILISVPLLAISIVLMDKWQWENEKPRKIAWNTFFNGILVTVAITGLQFIIFKQIDLQWLILFPIFVITSIIQNYKNGKLGVVLTDKKTIKRLFPDLGEFDKCYWIRNEGWNPYPFLMKEKYTLRIFVVLDKRYAIELKENYLWENAGTEFPELFKEMTNSNWVYNSDFEEKLLPSKFSGDVYFDDINGVIFLDIEKN